jgi:hypothetical protein
LAAVQRWGSDRVKNAVRFAAERNMILYLLTAERGLISPEDRVPPGGAALADKEIGRASRLVQRQLEEKNVSELYFLANPSNRLALAYIRTVVLACERANSTLELLDHRGKPFPDWSKTYRQAQEARVRALKGRGSIEEVFADLFRRYGEEDGMIWFERGQAFMGRNQPAKALADFELAAQIFTMKEWRDSASNSAKRAAREIPPKASLSASIGLSLAEIEQLVRDPVLKRLSSEAFCVADESPSASIILCYAAVERVKQQCDRLQPDLEDRIARLRNPRHEAAHGSRIAGTDEAASYRSVLLDTLRFVHKRDWKR